MNYLRSVTLSLLFCTLWYGVQAQDREFNLDETYSIEAGGTIHLKSDDAEVTVTGSDRPDVHVLIYRHIEVDGLKVESSGTFGVEVENRGGDLYITENDTEEFHIVMGSINEEYRITIEAPHDIALEMEGDDDYYRISDINRGVRLKADDTEVELTGVKGETFSFDVDDGSIEMDAGKGTLELKMDDGEFYVAEGSFTEIEAEADDGTIDITTSLSDNGLYLFDMDDGAIELNITGGSAEIEIDHDNPAITAGDRFERVRSDEGESVYRLGEGEARVFIDVDDARIELENSRES